jgi:multisubunit Na+/H+ antiporter MnhF subunit
MHPTVFILAIAWCFVLIALLAFHAVRARDTVDKLLALDTLSLVFIAALTIFALHRGRSAYLDVALMLALIAFAQTLAGVHYAGRGMIGA